MLKYFFPKTITEMSEKSPYTNQTIGQTRSPAEIMFPNKLLLAKMEKLNHISV